MRLIGHLDNENDAQRITTFLKRKGIETRCDGSFDANTGHMSYQIWGCDEDRLEEAKREFDKFVQEPTQAAYDTPITEQMAPGDESVMREEEVVKNSSSPFTVFIIALCTLIFLLNYAQEKQIRNEKGLSEDAQVITPIQTILFFDAPPQIEELVRNGSLETLPIWGGVYHWVVAKIKGEDTSFLTGPLFIKIREGEVWRLFSPAILHVAFLHILFNMIWVWVLSRPIEQKIGIFRFFVLSLIIGIGSNVSQYLMSGPFFIGYSGVVMGLAGFIWMREKVAPWEGYPLPRSTILFLLVYIGGILLIQIASFFLQIFTNIAFSPAIANTAHISGALIGACLGKLSFFSQKVTR